jgi:hypothetical protein
MKKTTQGALIVAGCLMLLGALFAGFGLYLSGVL